MINEQIYAAAAQLMAAAIIHGTVHPLRDTERDYLNKYCIEKAIQLQKDVNEMV